jgi:hypothetical protein
MVCVVCCVVWCGMWCVVRGVVCGVCVLCGARAVYPVLPPPRLPPGGVGQEVKDQATHQGEGRKGTDRDTSKGRHWIAPGVGASYISARRTLGQARLVGT